MSHQETDEHFRRVAQNIELFFYDILILKLVFLIEIYLFKIFKGKFERFFVLSLAGGAYANLVDSAIDGCVIDPFSFFGLFHEMNKDYYC